MNRQWLYAKQPQGKIAADTFQWHEAAIPVARDGLTIYVHDSNPLKEITIEQLRRVYTGELTNWKDLGGADGRIVLYSRENSSGTYVYFKDNVLMGKDYAAACQTLPGTAAVVNAVSKDVKGIGYGGAAYAKGVKEVAVSKEAGSPAILPTGATIRDGSYPISRDLYFYTRTKPSGKVKLFVDWVLSDEGQSIVGDVGYFPIR